MTALILNLILLTAFGGVSLIKAFDVNESKRDFYTAGVVEFHPNLYGMSSADMLADHLKAYEAIIRSMAANETDIIVFPEGTLNSNFQMTTVPAAREEIIPCLQQNSYADFFIKLSCISRDVKKYLIINLTEKENCTNISNDPRPCAATGLNIYNTNVVFDRSGRVISRYRKVHIYVEAKNTTYEPEYGIFETDFGVRFGHFICFDILFYTPAQELVTKYGIKDFIFTSLFYSELPFLTATQLQHSWAWGNNVNLLAAGASYPESGITGTGIYAGNAGHLVAVMTSDTGERKLYTARVPSMEEERQSSMPTFDTNLNQRRQTGIKLMKDPQITNYNSKLLDFSSETYISLQLCHENFCCDLKVKGNYTPTQQPDVQTYKYRFGVFDGRRTYEKDEWSDIKVCAVYACTNEAPTSCGEIFEPNTKVESNIKFEFIKLHGQFIRKGEALIMPNSLNDQLYSLNSDEVDFRKFIKGDYFDVLYVLKTPKERLLTFGIYAHYFGGSMGAGSNISFALLILSLIATLILRNF